MGHGAGERAHAELGYDLETPAGAGEVSAVEAVGVVVVEDGFDRFWRFDVPDRGGDVDPFVCPFRNKVCAFVTKGRITASMYRSSATSAIGADTAKSDRSRVRIVASLTGIPLPNSSTSVHASIPFSR